MAAKEHHVQPKDTTARQGQPADPVRKQPDLAASMQLAIADPATAAPGDILALQRAAGNRAVGSLIQARLTVGAAGDRYEQEADRVAQKVMSMPAASGGERVDSHFRGNDGGQPGAQRQEEEEVQTKPLAATITPVVQRQEEEEELQMKPLAQRQEEEEELQMKPLAQRQEEEEELQMKPLIQRQEEEEELQMKPLIQRQEEEEELQMKPLAQRQEEEEELQMKPLAQRQEEEEELQTKHQGDDPRPLTQDRGGSFEAGAQVENRLAARRGAGDALPDSVRAFMEPRFGADFGGVRVHTDSEAAELNRSLSAQAFTHGQDIYMPATRYEPGTDAGKRLLAHELTHVVQQTGHVQPSIQRWSIRSRIKGLPEGHELLTKESLAQAGLTEEKLKELGLSGGSKDIVEGSTWNDLPGLQLLERVHYGDLQFLHSMASNPLEKAGETLEKILMWAEFCYKVATGVIDPKTKLAEIEVGGFAGLWQGRFRKWSVSYLFSTTGSAETAKGKALGSMMHMLQDSFCASHVERVGAKRRGEEVARIKSFHAYPEQDSKRHGLADLLAKGENLQERIKATAGAEDAVQVGKTVLAYLADGAPWLVVKSYLQTVLGLVEPERGEGGPGEAGPGRQFRKSVHQKYMKDSAVTGRRRSTDLKAIDTASATYDKMLLYESTVLSPDEAIGRKQGEQIAIEAVLDAIAAWRKTATKSEIKKRGGAVDELEKAMRADYVTINEEIADINRAQSH
jgi:hypothetical protein